MTSGKWLGSIGEIENNYLNLWTEEGYKQVGDELIKGKTKYTELIKGENIKISYLSKEPIRKVISLRKVFGETILNESDAVMIRQGIGGEPSLARITRKDRRVEVTRKTTLSTGNYITIVPITIEEEKDIIKIKTLRFETYVRGVYPPTGKKIDIKGVKIVIVGENEPEGADESFWEDLYKEIKEDILNEFVKALAEDEEYTFDDEQLSNFAWEIKRGFSKSSFTER